MSFKFKANLTQLFKQFQFICDITANRDYYTNPLLTTNSPDPGVVRLVDGSGWAMVTTSNNVSRTSVNMLSPCITPEVGYKLQQVYWVFF